MPKLQVDTLNFDFEVTVAAQIYDQWQHYTCVWNAPPGGQKAVDVVAVQGTTPKSTVWLLEAKDFRVITQPPRPCNIGGLAQLVADKAQHTLAGLADASAKAVLPSERQLATDAMATTTRRVALHLEPHAGPHSALFPAGFSASILQRLRQLVKAIDPNPLVLNITNTPTSGVPWIAS